MLAHMRRLQHRRIMLKLTARNSQCSKFLYSILLKETRKQLSCYAHVHFLVYGEILSPDVSMRMVKNSIHFTLILNIIIHIEQSGCRVRLGKRGVWYWVGLRCVTNALRPIIPYQFIFAPRSYNTFQRFMNRCDVETAWKLSLFSFSAFNPHMHIHFISKEKLDTTF